MLINRLNNSYNDWYDLNKLTAISTALKNEVLKSLNILAKWGAHQGKCCWSRPRVLWEGPPWGRMFSTIGDTIHSLHKCGSATEQCAEGLPCVKGGGESATEVKRRGYISASSAHAQTFNIYTQNKLQYL